MSINLTQTVHWSFYIWLYINYHIYLWHLGYKVIRKYHGTIFLHVCIHLEKAIQMFSTSYVKVKNCIQLYANIYYMLVQLNNRQSQKM